jgi:hypothetical protein
MKIDDDAAVCVFVNPAYYEYLTPPVVFFFYYCCYYCIAVDMA